MNGERSGIEALGANGMMAHLLQSLEAKQDIGHYGRLVFAMVARYFLDKNELLSKLCMNPWAGESSWNGAHVRAIQGIRRLYSWILRISGNLVGALQLCALALQSIPFPWARLLLCEFDSTDVASQARVLGRLHLDGWRYSNPLPLVSLSRTPRSK